MFQKQLDYIRNITDFEPEIAVVLGSGLGGFINEMEVETAIDYNDIPEFPYATAPTHRGRMVFGRIGKAKVAVMQGRVHLYEGYTPQQAVLPIRLLSLLGAKTLILSNAAGGINRDFQIGDLMIIEDHISSLVPSPLRGRNIDSLGVRFPDMSDVYSKRLRKIIAECAMENGIETKKGVYIQLQGPAFETKAEIRMCSILGADAVGMSTVIEAQAAKHCGMEICGISCITNLACGLLDQPITSEEVSETAAKAANRFNTLIKATIERIADEN